MGKHCKLLNALQFLVIFAKEYCAFEIRFSDRAPLKVWGDALDIKYYRMKQEQVAEVVALIHSIMDDYGVPFESKVSVESFKKHQELFNIEVAERDGKIVGFCAWMMTYSTWRGQKGMYVIDNLVKRGESVVSISKRLLGVASIYAAASDAKFIRMEIDLTDEICEQLYSQIGFKTYPRQSPYYLEHEKFSDFLDTQIGL